MLAVISLKNKSKKEIAGKYRHICKNSIKMDFIKRCRVAWNGLIRLRRGENGGQAFVNRV